MTEPQKKEQAYFDNIQKFDQPNASSSKTIDDSEGVIKKWNLSPLEPPHKTQQSFQNKLYKTDKDGFVAGLFYHVENSETATIPNTASPSQHEPNSLPDEAANPIDTPIEPTEEQATGEEEMLFTADELMQVRDEAFEEGYASGLKEGQEAAEESTKILHDELMERLTSALQVKDRQHEQALDELTESMLLIFKAALEKIIPVYLMQHGDQEIMAIINKALSHVHDSATICIRYHSDHDSSLQTLLQGMKDRNVAVKTIQFVTDDTIANGDVVIDWGNGGMRREVETIMNGIDEAVALIKANISQPEQNSQESQDEPKKQEEQEQSVIEEEHNG